jgi:hypothetical protein
MKQLLHKIWAVFISMLLVSLVMISDMPANAEAAPIEVTITADDMRAISSYMDSTSEIKGIVITTKGMAAFGYGGSPGTEPRPQLSVTHVSDSKGVNTLTFKTVLGDITKMEIFAGSVIVGVDVNYQVPAGWSCGDDWAAWEGNTSELVLDGADLFPGIIADPVNSVKFTIQPHVDDSILGGLGGNSTVFFAAFIAVLAAVAGTVYFRGKNARSSEKQ